VLEFAWNWLEQPLDPGRAHLVGEAVAWHGRLMVAAWGIALPSGVFIARFFKVLPRQRWPEAIDNLFWWRSHLTLQYLGGALMLAGAGIILSQGGARGFSGPVHGLLGYCVLALGVAQFLAGWLRGSKGGPTEPELRGDHYDMTRRRLIFEHLHKSVGYAALLLGLSAILSGLWLANAPRWMAVMLAAWWLALAAAAVILQRKGRAIDTYQAIWGPDAAHPGNRRARPGWGMRRPHQGDRA
jgi:hypothetical protein